MHIAMTLPEIKNGTVNQFVWHQQSAKLIPTLIRAFNWEPGIGFVFTLGFYTGLLWGRVECIVAIL